MPGIERVQPAQHLDEFALRFLRRVDRRRTVNARANAQRTAARPPGQCLLLHRPPTPSPGSGSRHRGASRATTDRTRQGAPWTWHRRWVGTRLDARPSFARPLADAEPACRIPVDRPRSSGGGRAGVQLRAYPTVGGRVELEAREEDGAGGVAHQRENAVQTHHPQLRSSSSAAGSARSPRGPARSRSVPASLRRRSCRRSSRPRSTNPPCARRSGTRRSRSTSPCTYGAMVPPQPSASPDQLGHCEHHTESEIPGHERQREHGAECDVGDQHREHPQALFARSSRDSGIHSGTANAEGIM